MTKRGGPTCAIPGALVAVSVLMLAAMIPTKTSGAETLLADAATGAGLLAGERTGDAVRPVAAQRCLRVRRSTSANTLVNFCGFCVHAKLEHQRPRGDFPIHRDVTVPQKGTVQLPLSFRSGRTRVLDEQRCGGGATDEANGERCVDIQRTSKGGTLLINSCRVCRAVIVERVGSRGERSMQTYTIEAKTYLPYGAGGSDRARVLAEKPCR